MKRPNKKEDKKKSNAKSKIINIVAILLLIIGLFLIFLNPIKNWLVETMSASNNVSNVTAAEIKKNNTRDGDFDFDKVVDLDASNIIRARLYQADMAVVGGIAVPDVKINLPITRGISNYNLAVGAGTMKPDQVMGEGNYALAGHNMIDKGLLFSPLDKLNMGDEIYLTDLEYIYVYKTSFIETVNPDRVDLIDDVEGKKLVTLVTCNPDGSKRLVIQGEFEKKVPMKKATKAMKAAFDLEKNT
ncbi:class A sortase [Carnobacterium gallinarum]|uniref:class A sortase n=1 Tax=Carnobacterium gallinarum TaxID=2749 RepID=UPI0005563A87|nr:class A sortase [Carnobacterium gallinarum]